MQTTLFIVKLVDCVEDFVTFVQHFASFESGNEWLASFTFNSDTCAAVVSQSHFFTTQRTRPRLPHSNKIIQKVDFSSDSEKSSLEAFFKANKTYRLII